MDIDQISALSRREVLTQSMTLGGVALAPAVAVSRTASASDAGAVDATAMHRKLRFRTDAGHVFWWLQGIKYGQVGTTLTPLYTNLVGTLQRITPTDDGGFEMTMLEMVITLDVDGDQPLSEWTNPYTGEVLPVTFSPVGPTTIRYRADDSRVVPDELGGARLESEAKILPPVIVGDDVFMSEVITARVYRPERDQPFVVNDLSTYHGSLADLTDPRTTVGAAAVSFAEVTGWQSWMNMGDRPGNLTSRTTGRKVARFDLMPEKWRMLLAEKAPHIAADPEASLDMPAGEFVR